MIIGTPVLVKAVLQKWRGEKGELTWERHEIPHTCAVVTGRGFRREGKVQRAIGGGYNFASGEPLDYEPAYLIVKRQMAVVLVRFAEWGKEYPVNVEDLLPAPADGWTLPTRRALPRWTSRECV